MTYGTTPTERGAEAMVASVVEIFEHLLGFSPIGPDEDFFDAGGHSLLAVQLVARVNAAFETDIPLSALFDADGVMGADGASPTAVARLVAAEAMLQDPDLVTLAQVADSEPDAVLDAGRGVRIVCVPPAGGEVASLREFAVTAAKDASVHAFRFPSVAPEGDTSIEALAARLLAALPSLGSPADRMVLLGWSMGGIVAFEAARRLAAAGTGPRHVVLADSYPAGTIPDTDDFGIVPALVEELEAVLGYRVPVDLAGAQAHSLLEGVEMVLTAASSLTDAERAVVRAKVLMLEAHVRAARQYRLRPYDGSVTLIQAAETGADVREAAQRAWQDVCPGLRTVVVPGGHLSLFSRPHVEATALAVFEAVA